MKTYTILKGWHYSISFLPKLFLVSNCNFLSQGGTIEFTDSCKYDINEPSCVNKLFGFSCGLFGVHKNSVRFGWTYCKETNNFYIWKYVYKDGVLHKEKIFECDANEKHQYYMDAWKSIDQPEQSYHVALKIDGNVVSRIDVKSKSWFALTLGPYFGGNTRAPHKIKILQY